MYLARKSKHNLVYNFVLNNAIKAYKTLIKAILYLFIFTLRTLTANKFQPPIIRIFYDTNLIKNFKIHHILHLFA